MGDSVLAVNGTNVTSVSHSEAAELAKQGEGEELAHIFSSFIGQWSLDQGTDLALK